MGRCGATELRGVTAGTTSRAASRLAVRVTAATLMPVPATAPVPVLDLVSFPVPVPVPVLVAVPISVLAPVLITVPVLVTVLVTVHALVTVPASILARSGRGEFRATNRTTGNRDEMPPGLLGGLPKRHPACLRYSYQ
jgi:hypothetical protein